MDPIFTAFYTRGTIYEAEADRLRRSLDRLELEYDIRAVDSRGDWIVNSRYTATHVCQVLADYPDRPVVQLDADAVVWRRPELFWQLGGVDVAAHVRRGHELLNGTVYFAPTDAARAVADRYRELVDQNPNCTNEQTMVALAINQLGSQFEFRTLPPSYCFIFDIMAGDVAIDELIVIEHLQASRSARARGSDAEKARLARLAEIDRTALS